MNKSPLFACMSIAVSVTMSVGFAANISPQVIYGNDDRRDFYQVNSGRLTEVMDASAAMIPVGKLTRQQSGGMVEIRGTIFGEDRKYCPDEPFQNQPVAVNCSSAFIGKDLVATAGHCITASSCRNYAFVFGFRMLSEIQAVTSVPAEDVYFCQEVIFSQAKDADYAIVRLDREVVGRAPITMAKENARVSDPVYVVGYPSGLPLKVSAGAQVREQSYGFFRSNLDTYGGNSGSPVLNENTHEMVGILVRGEQDYVYDYDNRCTRSKYCTNESCRGEDVTNISEVWTKVPQAYRSEMN